MIPDRIDVMVTNFGAVTIGRQWGDFIKSRTEGLDKRKNSAKYRGAKRELDRIETAISVMAEYEWRRGKVLKELP